MLHIKSSKANGVNMGKGRGFERSALSWYEKKHVKREDGDVII